MLKKGYLTCFRFKWSHVMWIFFLVAHSSPRETMKMSGIHALPQCFNLFWTLFTEWVFFTLYSIKISYDLKKAISSQIFVSCLKRFQCVFAFFRNIIAAKPSENVHGTPLSRKTKIYCLILLNSCSKHKCINKSYTPFRAMEYGKLNSLHYLK